ncbi:glycosyltransferase [Luteimonas yindakuii]|uniref:Glycosyltransferase n=1 Tax=Luteimonas yindakuii TaxID=2565782 RepID=A0A4Z1R4Y9_9GAMM|nr:glycosyltransferase [Luteimonas yindakuii]TKS54714.1 glycosyltransferase [Luteimonas yindakuii]
MPFSLTDAQFRLARALGLSRRAWSSLRTRGWQSTWQRVLLRVQRALRRAPVDATPLWRPAPAGDALPAFAEPDVVPAASIVIPVHNHVGHTLECLRALAAAPPAATMEIIVVDDASSDASATLLPRITGLRYHRRERNGGFIAACNTGAALARGEVLVFLNNDTVPQPGWLDALLETLREVPRAGIVGAQLVYPDGRLQEAGGVVFRDGQAWNYGRFESPEDPRYGYLRDADYVSGAALAIPRALFDDVGGFDTRYAPAYYEDTDLAFAVRAAGHRVLYQPAARVLHDEGTSAGTDPSTGMKAAQVRNREVFARHRAAELAGFPAPSDLPTPDTLHRAQRRILIVDESTPRPDHDSGSLRLVALMRMLLDDGAHVVFVPADGRHAGGHTRALQAMGVETWSEPWTGGIAQWLRHHAGRFDVAMLSRHFVAAPLLPLLRRHAPDVRILFDSVDLHYLRERRAAELANDATMLAIARRTRARELAVVAAADATLVVSAAERELLAADAPDAKVELLSNLHRVTGEAAPWERRHGVVFVGGFHHPPNVDALRWFLAEVWPRVHAQAPGLAFHCIGSDPPNEIATRHGHGGVQVHGHVADIAPWMDGCRVAVAPLRFGAGVKGKINLSMAHGQPVVATPVAAEGMHLHDGLDVLLADDADAFAHAVLRAHEDAVVWSRLSAGGRANVERHFSIEAARATVHRLFLDPAAG